MAKRTKVCARKCARIVGSRSRSKFTKGPGEGTDKRVKIVMKKKVKTEKQLQEIIYGRISSRKQIDQQGLSRQKAACAHIPLPGQGPGQRSKSKSKRMMKAEVISGSLDLDKRALLKSLLTGGPKRIYVESARAIARKAMVGEQAYQLGKKHGTEIIPADIPNLFTLNPKPSENFMRHVMLAVQAMPYNITCAILCNPKRNSLQ